MCRSFVLRKRLARLQPDAWGCRAGCMGLQGRQWGAAAEAHLQPAESEEDLLELNAPVTHR